MAAPRTSTSRGSRSDGVLTGDQCTGGGSHDTFSGRRDPAATLDDPASRSALKDGVDCGSSSVSRTSTATSLRFPGERHEGKVVLITVGGSWCPNCHDEAVFLKELLASRRERGLEVIQLMFERTPDFASQAKAARDFAAKFGIDYPVLIAGTTSDDDVLKKLPQISAFKAYPTLFVIDRKGDGAHGPHRLRWDRRRAATTSSRTVSSPRSSMRSLDEAA